jgi:serine/threonine-protein kinase
VGLSIVPSADALVGQVIDGKYRLTERLGEGGIGAVYRAEHVFTRKTWAVKLLHPEMSRIEIVVKRFEREARAASAIDHAHVVQVVDFGRAPEGLLYLVMENLEGSSLASAIEASRGLPASRAVPIATQVLGALQAVHAAGIVHRDLKPDNIMLLRRAGQEDYVKLLDFGIAKADVDGAGQPLTAVGAVFGTPAYMSPEQALGQPVDLRSDLFALGVILHEMVTGQQPFSGPNPGFILQEVLHGAARPVRVLDPSLPVSLEAVITRALAKRPEQRFQSATEMLQALEAVPLSPRLAVPPTPGPAPVKDERRDRAARGLVAWVRRIALLVAERLRNALPARTPPLLRWLSPYLLSALVLTIVLGLASRACRDGESSPAAPRAGAGRRG